MFPWLFKCISNVFVGKEMLAVMVEMCSLGMGIFVYLCMQHYTVLMIDIFNIRLWDGSENA